MYYVPQMHYGLVDIVVRVLPRHYDRVDLMILFLRGTVAQWELDINLPIKAYNYLVVVMSYVVENTQLGQVYPQESTLSKWHAISSIATYTLRIRLLVLLWVLVGLCLVLSRVEMFPLVGTMLQVICNVIQFATSCSFAVLCNFGYKSV